MVESLNYLSFGNWAYLERNFDTVTMGRGRMFEYTPPTLRSGLKASIPPQSLFSKRCRPFLCSGIFRGRSDAHYELTPSLLRKWNTGDWQFMPSEDRLFKELLIAHHDEF